MTFLPIVQRELLEASRRRSTYWNRVGAAGTGLVIGLWIMMFPEFRTPSRLGMALFIPLSIVILIYCALAGVFRTADCLSEEKREGTLGLLFLTDLRGHDIVLGKLAATSLGSIYGLMAMVPILAIPLLAGGVTGAEFGRVTLVAANTLFFSLTVGMFCSAVCREERRAMGAALGLLTLFIVGLPLLAGLMEEFSGWKRQGIAEWLVVPSPTFSALFAFEELRRGSVFGREQFLLSVAMVHILGWGFLALAIRIVPRTWQDGATREAGPGRAAGSRDRGAAAIPRRHLMAINPVLWLVSRQKSRLFWAWSVPVVGGLIWTAGLLHSPNNWKDEFAYVFTALCAHALIKGMIVTEACRQFSRDRQSGALELLLSTPLDVPSVIRGQTLGLERIYAGPIAVVLLADLGFLLTNPTNEGWLMLWGCGMIVFVADIVALVWLGMWHGLRKRRANAAAAGSFIRVVFLPWLLLALCMTVFGLSGLFDTIRGQILENYLLPLLYLGLSLGVDLVLGLMAREGLLQQFRQIATTRHDSRDAGRA